MNTVVFWLTANSPKSHVSPKRGRRTTDALIVELNTREKRLSNYTYTCIYMPTHKIDKLDKWMRSYHYIVTLPGSEARSLGTT